MSQDSNDIDLSQLDADFQQAPVEERSEEVPDGKYQTKVDTVEVTKTKTSGKAMLKWSLRIVGPTHAKRLLWRNNVISRETLKYLKADLHICGVNLEKLSDLPSRLGELLDVGIEVTVKTRGENRNTYFNRRIFFEDAPPGIGGAGGEGGAPVADDDIPW